jgi:glutamate-1-semialdehyde 2,1-aminomutase
MGSKELYHEALKLMPGGVSSPVRAYEPYPRFMARGRGPRIWDVEGREYIDLCLGFGPLILGHAHPAVVAALQAQAEGGVLLGSPTEAEVELAKKVIAHFPSIDMVRFTSSGTEATMHALRLARGVTGREDIIAVEGSFHGAHDALLARAGSGAAGLSVPTSAGVLGDAVKHTHLVPFNDVHALERMIKVQGDRVAAIIMEPVLGNIGLIPPGKGYLRAVRDATEEAGILLIFDEVITGFRLALGGAQQHYGVEADMTTLGKVLGGGLPVGAFGGRREFMEKVAPSGSVYQAGTYSGNPMTMAAGLATLGVLEERGLEEVNRLGDLLRRRLEEATEESSLPYTVQGLGSMAQVFFTQGPVVDFRMAMAADREKFMRFFRGLLDRGIYLPPSQYETWFLSLAHGKGEVEVVGEAAADVLRGLGA